MKRTIPAVLFSIFIAAGVILGQAAPPPFVNYQGVLRDNNDRPLTGSFDMTFHFMSDATEGVEIFVDAHRMRYMNPVQVTGGLFNVQLGRGEVGDGSGPGTYTSLSEVFRDYGFVYLKIVVNGEELSGRPWLLSAPSAVNSDLVDGKNASDFSAAVHSHPGTDITSAVANSDMLDGAHESSFLNLGSTAQAKLGTFTADASALPSSLGIVAKGSAGGGQFSSSAYSGFAYVAAADFGIQASGNTAGGSFWDANGSGYALVGYTDYGIQSAGNTAGGFFMDANSSGYSNVGDGDYGIRSYGDIAGGYFQDHYHTGSAYVGYGNTGIDAEGNFAGGYFRDADNSGAAYVGYGDLGIDARGDTAGGYFQDTDGYSYAWVGNGYIGIAAYGEEEGGYFTTLDSCSSASVASGCFGIQAAGNNLGGYFADADNSGYAYVGYGDNGLEAYGNNMGGYFKDLNDLGDARLGLGQRGIWGRGSFAGGTFSSLDGVTVWADVAHKDGYKIKGVGAVSFVQNHPYDATRSIVYAAPEGDEVAVYTRGTARLVKGEARVPLGDTFRWVANPDIGLTAHLTPHGEAVPLAVVSLTTNELVVRGPEEGSSDLIFDYLVYGLRLGFEELAILQAKERDALPPAADAIAKPYEGHQELRASNALERYKAMRLAAGETGEPDLSRAHALLAALEAQRAEAVARGIASGPSPADGVPPPPPTPPDPNLAEPQRDAQTSVAAGVGTALQIGRSGDPGAARRLPTRDGSDSGADGARSIAADSMVFPVSETVEPGDLLAFDPERPGELRRALSAGEAGVVGVAAAAPSVVEGESRVLVAGAGFASVKADASFAAILPGDFLVSSDTPGHVMKAPVPAPAGAVVGRAMEKLEAGTGLIRILVMPH